MMVNPCRQRYLSLILFPSHFSSSSRPPRFCGCVCKIEQTSSQTERLACCSLGVWRWCLTSISIWRRGSGASGIFDYSGRSLSGHAKMCHNMFVFRYSIPQMDNRSTQPSYRIYGDLERWLFDVSPCQIGSMGVNRKLIGYWCNWNWTPVAESKME